MNYENFRTDYNKPSIFTAQQYGTKVSVEVDKSDMDLDEVMDAFQTLIIGLGYHQDAFKNWVIERADEYRETDAEELKEKLSEWRSEDVKDIVFHNKVKDAIKNGLAKVNEEEDEFFGKWDEGTANKRMDVIGQNGNDGLHYRATEEDEDEFDDYGQRIHPTFEWGDEPEDDVRYDIDETGAYHTNEDWDSEDIEWPKPNNVLIDAKKQYDEQVKMSAKKKSNKK